MLSNRSLISLAQLLALQPHAALLLLFEKCGVRSRDPGEYAGTLEFLRDTFAAATPEQINHVVHEIVRLAGAYRTNTSPKWLYHQHWNDFQRCLMLDGYHITGDYQNGYDIL